eukprot:12667150-Alexandrium_andersonii.AAC.1
MFRDRIDNATLRFSEYDECVELLPSQGMPPGDSKAAELFSCKYRHCVVEFLLGSEEHEVVADTPWVGE